jgi:hypothetical protein
MKERIGMGFELFGGFFRFYGFGIGVRVVGWLG